MRPLVPPGRLLFFFVVVFVSVNFRMCYLFLFCPSPPPHPAPPTPPPPLFLFHARLPPPPSCLDQTLSFCFFFFFCFIFFCDFFPVFLSPPKDPSPPPLLVLVRRAWCARFCSRFTAQSSFVFPPSIQDFLLSTGEAELIYEFPLPCQKARSHYGSIPTFSCSVFSAMASV